MKSISKENMRCVRVVEGHKKFKRKFEKLLSVNFPDTELGSSSSSSGLLFLSAMVLPTPIKSALVIDSLGIVRHD